MSPMIDGKNYGFTNQGNPYKKSNTGKKVGTAVAVALPTAAMFVPYKTTMKLYSKVLPKDSLILESMKEITKDVTNPIELGKQFIKGKGYFENLMINEFVPKFLKSKGVRAAILATSIAAGLAIYAGIGRLVGAGVDKIINHHRKAQADKAAQA